MFSANTTVYAHWTHTGDNNPPVNYYTLRFETGGGSAIPGVQETYNTYIDLTKYVPTRHGYTFVGWYSERSLVNKVSDIYLTGIGLCMPAGARLQSRRPVTAVK